MNLLHLPGGRNDPPPQPPNKGRLLFVKDVLSELLGNRKSASWVRHHFAPNFKLKVGRDCAWWEPEARAWLDSLKEAP